MSDSVTIYVDDRPYQVDASENLLQVCLSLGLDLPYFCWHPAMGSVGACRQCAVKQFKDEQDRSGRLIMACMSPAVEGTRISIADPEARDFRTRIIEWLMESHPHDCPVCDEGGECHLQDMTVMTGHNYRRYRFRKRTFENQDLGPFINHEMNRCITCYRCVRFYRDYAGGDDLQAMALRNRVYFGRQQDGVLENEFSGNLVEVCPTGVFTDKTLGRHYTRKWDLQTAPSVCVHCGLGCNTTPGERYGSLRRILNRYHSRINGYFLCDRGRFGYGFVNHERRLRHAFVRSDDNPTLRAADATEAVQRASALLTNGSAIGIGSPRASMEANFALRSLVGAKQFFAGVSDAEYALLATTRHILRNLGLQIPSITEIEQADAVLVLGEDLPNTAPRLALAVRQSARQASFRIAESLKIPTWLDLAVRQAAPDARSPVIVATPDSTRLDDIATQTYRAAPDDLARLAHGIAHALDPRAPPVADLPPSEQTMVDQLSEILNQAQRPVVISGTGCGSEAVLHAAANLALALRTRRGSAALCLTVPEQNSLGLALLDGRPLGEARRQLAEGVTDTVIVLENDLYRRGDTATIDALLDLAPHLIVIDHLAHDTASRGEVVFPAATFAESEGTAINNEGRAQRYFQVFPASDEVRESWRWIRDMMPSGRVEHAAWENMDDLTAACALSSPELAGMTRAAPPADFRIVGRKIPREPHRYSGRTAMLADHRIHEPPPPEDVDAALNYSMEGNFKDLPSSLVPFFWAPGWNSNQSLHRFQSEVGGPLRGGDPGVRLFEERPDADVEYHRAVPGPFRARKNQFLLLPVHHIFGSEELSAYADAIAERVPAPYVILNLDDAEAVGYRPDMEVEVHIAGTSYRLPVRLETELPRGTAGLPVGIAPTTGLVLPAWGRITGAPP